jgi:hypothetical protein
MDFTNPGPTLPLDLPGQAVRPRASGITLWRPDILLAKATRPDPARLRVVVAEPSLRPAAVQAQNEAGQSVLASIAEAGRALEARAAAAEAGAIAAPTEQGRVTAVIEAYRLQAALDEVLQRTLSRARALLEERGLR